MEGAKPAASDAESPLHGSVEKPDVESGELKGFF